MSSNWTVVNTNGHRSFSLSLSLVVVVVGGDIYTTKRDYICAVASPSLSSFSMLRAFGVGGGGGALFFFFFVFSLSLFVPSFFSSF